MKYLPALGKTDHRHAVAREDPSFQDSDFGKRIAMVVNEGANQKERTKTKFLNRRGKI
jgi:hypothetical protein